MTEQGTKEWLAERAGFVTASRLNDVMSNLKSGGESATRKNYRAQLVAERLTGTKSESFTNSAMQWGTENEPFARASYEILHNVDIDKVGFVKHQTIELTGASPDGLIGNDGLIEIKCPNTATHIEYLIAGVVPSEYKNQMLWQMECTGRKWCDFVSYDPRLPEDLSLFVIRYEKDDYKLNELRDGVVKFLAEVKEVTEKLNALRHKEN